ncbi:MAG TPA: methyltransferase domain-containing protein [bacterium]|nr:methyltransferase domain-containing protein [bacterium]
MTRILEIGPGRGDFLFHLAEENPLATVVGVEVKPGRCEKLAVRLEKRGLANVELVCMEAQAFLPQCANAEFAKIFILFSDPWPKRRHAKNRLFQGKFVAELLRVLEPGGRVYVAHDDPRYVAQIRETFRTFAASFIHKEDGIEFVTFYADKWRKEGRLIWSFSYEKIDGKNREDIGGPCVHIPLEELGDVPQSATGS